MKSESLVSIIKCKIDPSHIDEYDHLNNARYPLYFEKGRIALQEKIGFPDSVLKNRGIGLIIYTATYEYKKRVLDNQEVEIHSQFLPYESGARFFIEHEMYVDEELVAKAKTRTCSY